MSKNSNTVQALWIGMGSLSTVLISLISAAVLSRYFDKSEYGTYKQILYVYNSLLLVFSAGLPKVFAYYLPRYNLSQGKEIVNRINKILFISGFIFSLFLFFGSDVIADVLNNPELKFGLKLFSPIPLLLLPTLGINGIFSAYRKTLYVAIYQTLTNFVMFLAIIIPVIFIENSYIYAIYGWIIASLFSLILALLYKKIPFKGVKIEKVELSYKEIFAYSLPIVTASFAGMAIRTADQFYISRYFGVEVFAEFSNGFIQLPFVGMIKGAAATVLMPVFSKIIFDNKGDLKELINLWNNTLIKSALIIYPILIFFMFNAHSTIVLIYSETYENSTIYFQLAMLLNYFNIIAFIPLILALGKTQVYSNLFIASAILVWFGEFLIVNLIPSPIAIAIFSILMTMLRVVFILFYCFRLLKVKPIKMLPLKTLSTIIIHSIVCVLVSMFVINLLSIPFGLLINFVSTGLLFGILLLSSGKILGLKYVSVINPIIKKVKDKLPFLNSVIK